MTTVWISCGLIAWLKSRPLEALLRPAKTDDDDVPLYDQEALDAAVATIEAENAALKAEINRQHAEILRLSMYAPRPHTAHVVKVTPQIAPTNFAFYGMADVETDFDSFGHPVPNEAEA